ncbi:MAG: NHL repeat-containing protein [Candidatus Omnitrophica bacterium]|nr:NHL repeat-containing protein [Candidatus Omnitrophota bacterium]
MLNRKDSYYYHQKAAANSRFHSIGSVATVIGVIVTGLAIFCLQASCEPESKYHRATIAPSRVHLETGEQEKFKVVMVATRLMAAAAPKEVQWGVNDIPGGNETYGTIDEEGVYTAPSKVPSPREIHICATVPESANPHLWATVVLGDKPPRYKSVRIWTAPVATESATAGHMTDPHGIALDPKGNILISDQRGHRVYRYTAEGEYLGEIGKGGPGTEPGQFKEPRMVIADATGNIFVTDSKGDRPRVQVFDPEGNFLRLFAPKGMKPGMILRCHGVGFDDQDNFHTVDVDNMRVNVYTYGGEFLYDWGVEGLDPGNFNSPHGLYIDRNNDVFVSGYYGPTQKFNSEGDFLLSFCPGDPPDGSVYFHSLTGDKWGNVYVTCRTSEGYDGALSLGVDKALSLMKFNNNGDFITALSFTAKEHRETSAVVGEDGRVYALFKGQDEMGVEIFEEE